MTAAEIFRILFNKTRGRFFTVQFVKQNGEFRTLNGKISRLAGPNDIDSTGHIAVWDAQKKAYRKVNLNTIHRFSCAELSL